MEPMDRFFPSVFRFWLLLALPSVLMAQFMTTLAPKTSQEFDAYEKSAVARMDWRARLSPGPGEVVIAAGEDKSPVEVTGGLIHDWRAATFAPGGTVEQAMAVLQDYANYKTIYAPEVVESRILGHEGNHWRLSMRMVKKKILTVTLNSEYEVENRSLSGGRWAKLSRSTRLTEISGGKELPEGTGHGFVWRMNAYWLIEPRENGVYIECRSISLSRAIPAALDWMIRPMITSVPRDSLRSTMDATVRALGHAAPTS